MISFPDSVKRKGIEIYINTRLTKLAKTRDENEFYRTFDQILKQMESYAGPTRDALGSVRNSFQRRHPLTQIARFLLQERLCKKVREKLAQNFFGNWIMEADKRDKLEKEGFKVPWFFVVSPTCACNLHCYGCYAHEYTKNQELSYSDLDRILREAKEVGIRFLTISGGEPFYYKDKETGKTILDLAKKHSDMFFQIYTNGTLLDERTIERLAKLGNIAPCISQEGFEKETDERRGKGVWKKICKAREDLSKAGVLHGFSVTVTRENADLVTSDEFVDDLMARKVSFGWYFIYIPIGKEPATELMPTPKQRNHLREKVWEWRSKKPIFIGDFWNDGPWVGGCIAGGRKYFHITSLGDVEPCVFIHFATENIYRLWGKGKSLRDAITCPFFMTIRKLQLDNDNWSAPCTIIDEPEYLREAVKKHNAYPTHAGAGTIIQGKIAKYLDEYAKQVRALTREEFKKMCNGGHDTKNVSLSKTIKNHRERNKREFEIQSKKSG